MRSFACPHCAALIFFQNSVCLYCSSPLGFHRESAEFVRLEPTSHGALGRPAPEGDLVICANLQRNGCNWLTTPDAVDGLCSCCALTRTRPADSDPDGLVAWALTEQAKRRLVFQLDTMGLPTTSRSVDPEFGLAFDLLSSASEPVTTGHADGVITIDLAEGDDPHREAVRTSLGEPYRTLLGHLRHEIGHWYFDVLVSRSQDESRLAEFRDLFGDERASYSDALEQHYGSEHSDAWRSSHVSDYAAAHPWEDWAETFAHYLHLTDTLETAYSYGVSVSGPRALSPNSPSAVPSLTSSPQPRYPGFDALIDSWLSLTAALNAVNQSMGKDDLYPFVLVPTVISKLRFVARMIGAPS